MKAGSRLTSATRQQEVEAIVLVTDLAEQKNRLKDILLKYNVKRAEEIESRIAEGGLPEHPTYEDFLSALSYQANILELVQRLQEVTEELGRL